MKGQWGKLIGWFIASLVVATAGTLGLPMIGGGSWLPDSIAREGNSIDTLFWGLVIVCLVIFAIVSAMVIYSMIHFRAEPGDLSDGEHIHGNAKLEVVWIIVPTIIVTIISIFSWQVLEKNEVGLFDAAKASSKGAAKMIVDVHAFSFGWNFRYTDTKGNVLTQKDVEPTSDLVLPQYVVTRFNVISCSGKEAIGRVREQELRKLQANGRKNEFAEIAKGTCEKQWNQTTDAQLADAVVMQDLVYRAQQKLQDGADLTADERAAYDAEPKLHGDQQYIDVNHAFWVPEARLKVDAVSGLPTYVQWTPYRVSTPAQTYQVVCAELCGSGHNAMRTPMCVISESNFEWYLGLNADNARNAKCVALRLLGCTNSSGDQRTKDIATLATLAQGKPDADCDDAKEAIAS